MNLYNDNDDDDNDDNNIARKERKEERKKEGRGRAGGCAHVRVIIISYC